MSNLNGSKSYQSLIQILKLASCYCTEVTQCFVIEWKQQYSSHLE